MSKAHDDALEMLRQCKPDGTDHPNWSDDAVACVLDPLLAEYVAKSRKASDRYR